MAEFLAVGENYATCPYDESHQVLKEKLSSHVVKCQMNFEKSGKEEMAICSYNFNHRVDKEDLVSHERYCPDRGNIIPHIAQHQDKKFIAKIQDRKTKSDQAFKKAGLDNEEDNWEEDSNHPPYDPSKRNQGPSQAPAPVPVLQTTSAKKASRSQYQQQLLEKLVEKNSRKTTDDQL